MRTQALFKSTYIRLHNILQIVQQIKDGPLLLARRKTMFEKISNVFQLANSIQHNVKDLQSQSVQSELSNVQYLLRNRNWLMFYDYDKKGFQLINNQQINDQLKKIRINIRSTAIQKLDHPHIRRSLYFHQLKDMEKYFVLKYPKNSPNFVKDIFRSNIQNQLIDAQNPLGLPIKAQPFQFMIELNEQFIIQFYSRFGNINLKTIRLLQKGSQEKLRKCHYVLYGMNIPRLVQKAIFQYTQNHLCLNEKQLLNFHKLSHIGGRIQQIQFLMNLFDFYSTDLVK